MKELSERIKAFELEQRLVLEQYMNNHSPVVPISSLQTKHDVAKEEHFVDQHPARVDPLRMTAVLERN